MTRFLAAILGLAVALGAGAAQAQTLLGGGGGGGGGTGCVPSGASGHLLLDNGSGACTTDAHASASNGALSLGASGTAGSIVIGNATSGTITIQTVTGALGGVTLLLPDVNDTLAGIAATQTFTNKTLTSPTINAGALSGTFSGTPTYSGVPIYSGLSSGTIVSGGFMGLDSGNHVVLGSGGSGGGLTVGTTTITSGTNGRIEYNNSGVLGELATGTAASQVVLGGVITAGGPTGSATVAPIITYNAAGQLTTVSSATITPAVGSITGLGTGVGAALADNVGSAGAPVVFNGAGGTPSSITLSNGTGLPISTGVSGLGTGVATAAGNAVNGSGGLLTYASLPTVEDAYGNSVASVTTITVNGAKVSGSGGSATINPSQYEATVTSSCTVEAASGGCLSLTGGDMNGAINLGGSGATLTLGAATSANWAPGQSFSFVSTASGNWTLTNSSGLTLSGLNNTSTIYPGESGTFVANQNATGLDFFPGMQPPTSTGLGGVLSSTASSHQFATAIAANTGVVTYTQPVVGDLSAVAADTILGNATGSSAAPTATIAPVLGVQQTSQGSITLNNTAAGAYGVKIQSSNSATAGYTLTLPTTAGTNGYSLTTNGSGVLAWSNIGGGGTGCVPAGSSGDVLTDNGSGACNSPTDFTFSGGTITLGTNTSELGAVKMFGSTSGSLTIEPPAAAGTSSVLKFPGASFDFSGSGGAHEFVKQTSSGGAFSVAAIVAGDIPAAAVPAEPLSTGSSTGNTLTGPSEIFQCTAACTVTPPVPAAGYQFCVYDKPGTSGAIVLGANTGVFYSKTDHSAYGSSGGTLTSGGATGDSVCVIGVDSTHYDTAAYAGTWTAS